MPANTFTGPTLDGWSTTIDTNGTDSARVTATKGKSTMSASESDVVKLDGCPDVNGDVTGSRTLDITLDVDAKDGVHRPHEAATSRPRRPRRSPAT